jgi:hypothetical protein
MQRLLPLLLGVGVYAGCWAYIENIFFADNKTIDLFKCTPEQLHEFINISDPSIIGTIRVILAERDKGIITTKELFLLIKIFKRQGVRIVRIVDESCNSGDVRYYPDPENTGYGGKKIKKRRSMKFKGGK